MPIKKAWVLSYKPPVLLPNGNIRTGDPCHLTRVRIVNEFQGRDDNDIIYQVTNKTLVNGPWRKYGNELYFKLQDALKAQSENLSRLQEFDIRQIFLDNAIKDIQDDIDAQFITVATNLAQNQEDQFRALHGERLGL